MESLYLRTLTEIQDWTMKPIFYTIVVLCLSYVSNSSLTQEIKIEIVNLHNTLRRHFAHGQTMEGLIVSNMKKLVWSSSLEQRARTIIRLNCTLSFLNVATFDNFTNVAWNSHGNFTQDILHWYNEIRRYSVPNSQCIPPDSCTHAIKMLNATQGHIGCAYRRNCMAGFGAFICIYENNNNNDNEIWHPEVEFYKSGPICTQCSTPTSFCEDGLCAACDINSGSCDCRKTCYAHGIGNGVLDHARCSCTCQYGMGLNCEQPCVDRSFYDFYEYDICSSMSDEECSHYDFVRERCSLRCGVCNAIPEA